MSHRSPSPLAIELEHVSQRHLDLSRASDGLVRDAQPLSVGLTYRN
jgi:hypothetical protein